ncbi:hypothetical protein [Tumebacillus flagellatus]|uniref:Prepilin-type N-terminal cleavage/methylation domain-containing protein n=1 Tax=Tumebacillus flagellatus TaxID=1157490 RepID=A0A074LQA9_9BACL|nr:hypothetical protein [Tumebacillus flagellatus]KEO82660.1 hypothetical protein EL26_13925 [Tumebacillus flagellatus]
MNTTKHGFSEKPHLTPQSITSNPAKVIPSTPASNQRGFVLLETLLALFLLSLALLTAAELWQASAAQDRKANLHLLVSRLAVSTLEEARAKPSLSAGTTIRDVASLLQTPMPITEASEIKPDPISGLTMLTLTYTWNEGGRSYVQTLSALHL